MLAPGRSGSLEKFTALCRKKSDSISYTLCSAYDEVVTNKHETYLRDSSSNGYNPDLHFPSLIILRLK